MGYLAAYYQKAENKIRQRKFNNQAILLEHERIAQTQIKHLKSLIEALSHTGFKICDAAFSGGKEKIESLQKENAAIEKQIKNLLIENGFPENYLDPIYSCPECKDTGMLKNERCSCFKREVKKLIYDEINNSVSLKLSSFDKFKLDVYPETALPDKNITVRALMRKNLDFCKNYAENFSLPQNGILMTGATGLGKTHLSLATASAVIAKGYYTVYGSALEILENIEREHFGSAEYSGFFKKVKECDLLILDDLGTEFKSDFYISALYNILNSRINSGLPVIVNTNLTFPELKNRYPDSVCSRLISLQILKFFGSDMRVSK